MKMRSIWKGTLTLSLVHVPIHVYPGLNHTQTIHFHQLHRDCHQRVRQKLCCPAHGEISREEIVKGYEFDKDQYAVFSDEDLEKVRLETTHTIEILQFVRPEELDSVFLDTPYFMVPNGRLARESYAVLHAAIRRSKLLGIGRVVLGGKEKPLALKALEKGLMFTILRPPVEVRKPDEVFADLERPRPEAQQVQLALRLIAQQSRALDLNLFSDRYQSALLQMIQDKVAGKEPVLAPSPGMPMIDLMTALQNSVKATGQRRKQTGQPMAA